MSPNVWSACAANAGRKLKTKTMKVVVPRVSMRTPTLDQPAGAGFGAARQGVEQYDLVRWMLVEVVLKVTECRIRVAAYPGAYAIAKGMRVRHQLRHSRRVFCRSGIFDGL